MSKNVIHNFNLSIQNSADIKSSEHLINVIIKELVKVSQEMSQQKDIVQLWQEQQTQNAILNNSNFSTEGGANETITEINKKTVSLGNTPSVSGEIGRSATNVFALFDDTSLKTKSTFSAPVGEGVTDNSDRTKMSSFTSANITSPILGVNNNGLTTQTYANVSEQQSLTVPQMLQISNNEPTIEVIKAEIKKKLKIAIEVNDTAAIEYWTNISKAFDERDASQDFYGKPGNELFTEMYALLKKTNSTVVENHNFNWSIVRVKMLKAIDANILKGKISKKSKTRWETIKRKLNDDSVNIGNLFQEYDELFLLLKEVEGLNALPSTITITTQTKVYPNLSANKLHAPIGKENVYVFLKKEKKNTLGSEVIKGALKIKNTEARSFIVGENLEFFLDETFVVENLHKKEYIDWAIYEINSNKKLRFIDKGTALSYSFDNTGTYRIEAFGDRSTVNGKDYAFIELKIVAQEIEIIPPVIIKDKYTRIFTEEKIFKIGLKNPEVKTLNPLKLYYQVEFTTAKETKLSDLKELDSTGIVKLTMPDFGKYTIKAFSNDQYNFSKELKITATKNHVNTIIKTDENVNDDVYLYSQSNNQKATFKVNSYIIEPALPQEKANVKWLVYDKNGKIYTPEGSPLQLENNEAEKQYLAKGESFTFLIPEAEGDFTIEAYSNIKERFKSTSIKKITVKHPQITEAYWAWSSGSKKETSGFLGERSWIKANMPYYSNKTVRIYFYLNAIKTNHYIDVKTNQNGEIFKEVKFDSDFMKRIEFKNRNAKIGFKLLGIQNGKPYPFKTPVNYESDTVLSVTTDTKILDAYFMYEDSRVTAKDEISFNEKGTTITIVAKTQNMIGKQIVLTAHKAGEKPTYRNAVTVNSNGVATTKFLLKNLNKKLKKGTKINYYVGIEGYSTKHLTDKVLVMIEGEGKKKVQKISNDIKSQEARIRAFLRMIRVGEGTTKSGGYEKLFGGSSFINDYKRTWKDHPRILIKAMGKDANGKKKEYKSTASGAYQILEGTWDVWGKEFREFYGIKDFSPESQDKFTLVILKHKLLKNNKIIDVIRLIREDKIEDAVKLCRTEWASLPNSPHGQPTVTWDTAIMKYNEFLKEELNGKSSLSIKPGFLKDLGYGDDQKNEISNDVQLRFTGKSANKADLSFKTINLLKEVASVSKNFTINVTSTKRATHDQARIMYENCRQTGGKYQKEQVYNNVGDQVIEVYILEAEIGKKAEEIVIKKMEEKIIELGAESVSKHLGDYIFLETFDIQYSGLDHPKAFKKEFDKRKEIDGEVLYEPKNNCYHIQVNQ